MMELWCRYCMQVWIGTAQVQPGPDGMPSCSCPLKTATCPWHAVHPDKRRAPLWTGRELLCMRAHLQGHHQVPSKVVDGALRQPHVLAQQRHEVATHAVLEDEPQVVGRLVPARAARSQACLHCPALSLHAKPVPHSMQSFFRTTRRT